MKLVNSKQMRQLEELSDQAGTSTDALMENAGLAVAERVREQLDKTDGLQVLVLVGPGNNGGDGLVAARHLSDWGAKTTAYLCSDRPQGDPHMVAVNKKGTTVVRASEDDGLARLTEALESADVVVDAVLGTGRSRPIEGALNAVLTAVSDARDRRPDLRVIAVDLPTGVDADTGAVDPACVRADVTVALGLPKPGLYAFPGAEHTGLVDVADIGLPEGLDGDVNLDLMTREWARDLIPRRPPSAHKGTFGRALIVAGSRNYVGAAYLASSAAGRSGAGLVTLAVPQSLQMAVAAKAPEPTYLPLPEASYGVPSPDAADLVLESVGGYQSLLVGCGMGQAPQTWELLDRLLLSGRDLPPTVIDADGLNFLSATRNDDWWERLSSPAIVTPHPGEMGRLTGASRERLEADRVPLALESAARWNKVVVLKGAFTVVAFPDGRAMLSPSANPGLATAGTGDVLAGTIAGLLAQGLSLEDGAALGVYLHGRAGERARDRLGEAGMLASDLLDEIPLAIKETRERS